MLLQLVAFWHQFAKVPRAGINVGDLVAPVAVEVMVVVLVDLIAIRLARQRNHIDQAV